MLACGSEPDGLSDEEVVDIMRMVFESVDTDENGVIDYEEVTLFMLLETQSTCMFSWWLDVPHCCETLNCSRRKRAYFEDLNRYSWECAHCRGCYSQGTGH